MRTEFHMSRSATTLSTHRSVALSSQFSMPPSFDAVNNKLRRAVQIQTCHVLLFNRKAFARLTTKTGSTLESDFGSEKLAQVDAAAKESGLGYLRSE